jgi:hypothetical protein
MSDITGGEYEDELSSATETESLGTIDDYDQLKDKTRKLKIIESEDTETVKSTREERSDEFLRNFFIKFGMKKTLDMFSQEWFENKANGNIDMSTLPIIPDIFRVNLELSDKMAMYQEELDEARITTEKAKSTYDKLKK